MKELSIRLIDIEAWWHDIGIQEHRKIIDLCIIHILYPMMHHVREMEESIRRIGSGHNSNTNRCEWLHIGNVKEAYRSTNKADYIQQMQNHNNQCTSLDYMQQTLSYLALQCWYDIDSVIIFNLLSAANKW